MKLSNYIALMIVAAGVVGLSLVAYGQYGGGKSDLPEGWEEPAPTPPGTVRIEDAGKGKEARPTLPAAAQPAPTPAKPAPVQSRPAEAAPAAEKPATGYGTAGGYPGAQIPPVTGPYAKPPVSGAPGAAPRSDLPEGWEEEGQPVPAGAVKIENAGKKPALEAAPKATPKAAPEVAPPPAKKAVDETEVIGEEKKTEEPYSKPSRWEGY
jgi:hypothetical protein